MVDHDGTVPNSDGTSTKYGNMAPSVLVVAPSASGPTDIINDFNTGSGIFTTDRTDPELGYNVPALPSGIELDIDTFPDDDYTSRFGGTSAAAPLVSGVIALMLEANPNLTWRDVQEILVRSSRQNDDLDESWITNLVPLFRDPFPHNPGPTNYPGDGDACYPSDEDQWNDEIVYQLVYAMPTTPPVQASTDIMDDEGNVFIQQATNSEFTVTANADKEWDGWVANNLTLTFRTADLASSSRCRSARSSRAAACHRHRRRRHLGRHRSSDRAAWSADPDESDPVEGWFEVTVSDAAGLFEPIDEAIRAQVLGRRRRHWDG